MKTVVGEARKVRGAVGDRLRSEASADVWAAVRERVLDAIYYRMDIGVGSALDEFLDDRNWRV